MIDPLSKKLLSIFKWSSRYQEVEMKVSLTSDWLSFERDSMKSLSLQKKIDQLLEGIPISIHRNTFNLSI